MPYGKTVDDCFTCYAEIQKYGLILYQVNIGRMVMANILFVS